MLKIVRVEKEKAVLQLAKAKERLKDISTLKKENLELKKSLSKREEQAMMLTLELNR